MLFIGSFEAFKHINRDRIGRIIMIIILVMGVFSGFLTVKNARWLYVGKIPYLTYRPPTFFRNYIGRGSIEIKHARGYKKF